MGNAELAAVLVQGYLRQRRMPPLLHDAVIHVVQARLRSDAQPYLPDFMQADIDNQSSPASTQEEARSL